MVCEYLVTTYDLEYHLCKAFDTVDHQILLNKMYKYGIRGIAFKWMESYLSNRHQFVLFKDVKSEYATVTYGVHKAL